jgi:hypothetical protein
MATGLSTVTGQRTLAQNAELESGLLHNRNLIEFLCGSYKTGARHADLIQPANFLGHDWWPEDVEFDRRLRGRLPTIHQSLAHLSWQRVLDRDPIWWALGFLAWETSWGMKLFVDAVTSASAPCWEIFGGAQDGVRARLPAYEQKPQTVAPLASHRRATLVLRASLSAMGFPVHPDWIG